jgi:hypothetical protein
MRHAATKTLGSVLPFLLAAVACGIESLSGATDSKHSVSVGGVITQETVILYVQRIHDDDGHYVTYFDQMLDAVQSQGSQVAIVFWPEDKTRAVKAYGAPEFARKIEDAKAEVRAGRAEPDEDGFNRGLEYCTKQAGKPTAHIIIVGRDPLFKWLSPSEVAARKEAIKAAVKACKIDAILVGSSAEDLAGLINGTRVSVQW